MLKQAWHPAGTVGVFAAPVVGAMNSGVRGFALGCVAGKQRFLTVSGNRPCCAASLAVIPPKTAPLAQLRVSHGYQVCHVAMPQHFGKGSSCRIDSQHVLHTLWVLHLACLSYCYKAGVAGAVALPVMGVAVGVAQVARGLANTPEAITAKASGKHWDQV